jgi:sterol 3beta-glucosyltransferase
LIAPPKMTIVILVVGTRGDVQPFIYFGQALQRDGHRVRLATHTDYRNDVIQGGIILEW